MIINNVRVQKLRNDISNYDGFVLYGAGYISNQLLDAFSKTELWPLYCVVTSLEGELKRNEAMPVYSFSDKMPELREKNILVVVAVSDLYEKEIVQILHSKGIGNIALASDYFWMNLGERGVNDTYVNKDLEWYVHRIEEWYFEQYGKKLNFPELCQREKGKKERILFVINNMSARVVKIVRTLQQYGKEVVIFQNAWMKPVHWEKFSDSLQKEMKKNIYYCYIEELILELIWNKGEAIHIFSNSSSLCIPYILIRLQTFIGKVVFEDYDILNGFYINVNEENLKLERYCIENAAGVCYREFSLEYLVDVLGFEIQGKSMRFLDYCSGGKIIKKKSNEKKELSLCYVGGVVTEEDHCDCPFGGFMELAEICENRKCHLHLYPSVWDENHYRNYIDKDKESGYFHFHKTISYDKLINEISQHDYGIMLTRDDVWAKEYSGYNTKNKYIYAGNNKFFDYLDAGLPIIAAIPLKMVQYLEEKGVLLNWTIGQYDFDYLVKARDVMQKNVLRVKEQLRMENHIGELLEFYESL